MHLTKEIYDIGKRTVERLCKKFSYTTGIEEEELIGSCWEHISYAIRFYKEEKKSINSFIYMSAHNEIMNRIYSKKREIDGNMKKYSYENLIDEEEINTDLLIFSDSLSSKDDMSIINMFLFSSKEAQDMVIAILKEDLRTKNAIKMWAIMNGYSTKLFEKTFNEIRRCMTC